jgi:hypothetical protein
MKSARGGISAMVPASLAVLPSGHPMNSRERVIAQLRGEPVDRLPVMPITMMFAGDLAGIRYGDYCRDHRRLVEGQLVSSGQEF